jgi:hypothetical protein
MGRVEAQLNGRGDLIDILPARAGGPDELLMNFFFADRDCVGNLNHAPSVHRLAFPGKCRFSPRSYSGPSLDHPVLNILHTGAGAEGFFYWRDEWGREVDCVWRRGRDIHAVECKINPDCFDPESLMVFRGLYPQGRIYLVPRKDICERRFDSLFLQITGCRDPMPDLEERVGREN